MTRKTGGMFGSLSLSQPLRITLASSTAYLGHRHRPTESSGGCRHPNASHRSIAPLSLAFRKPYAFSRRWEMLEVVLALNFAGYNFCRDNQALGITAAQAAGLTDHAWSVEGPLAAAYL